MIVYRETVPSETGSPRSRFLAALAVGVGLILLLVELPFYLASGLMAPLWAVVVLVLLWAALFGLGCYWTWASRHPYRVLALPVVAIIVWFAAMYLGETLLGWQA